MSQPMRILLVEDQADSARALAMLLRMDGHTVRVAGDLRSARAFAGNESFDVLLCDLGLPDGSGLDLMRQLKSLYKIKGIALTGATMYEDAASCRAAGFDAHLTKPFAPESLNSILEELARAQSEERT